MRSINIQMLETRKYGKRYVQLTFINIFIVATASAFILQYAFFSSYFAYEWRWFALISIHTNTNIHIETQNNLLNENWKSIDCTIFVTIYITCTYIWNVFFSILSMLFNTSTTDALLIYVYMFIFVMDPSIFNL